MIVICREWNILTDVGKTYEVIKIIEDEYGDRWYKIKDIKYGSIATWCFDIIDSTIYPQVETC